MYNFAFMLKTYKNDFKYAKRCIDSFNKYNVENLHMFIVCAKEEMEEFINFFRGGVQMIMLHWSKLIC